MSTMEGRAMQKSYEVQEKVGRASNGWRGQEVLKRAREFIGGQGGWRGTGSVREDHGGMEKTSDSLREPETGEGGQGGVERAREGSESRGGLEKPGRVEESQGGLEMSREC